MGPRKLQRVTSLSVDPPQLLVNINRQASSFSLIARHRTFGANILGADQRDCRAPWKTAPSASRGIAPSSDS
ncbi:flavin reductase family protein [Bradyrhizobium sp. 146]|nr:flavin reductase family protein [Bradyrhizobium sp. 146]